MHFCCLRWGCHCISVTSLIRIGSHLGNGLSTSSTNWAVSCRLLLHLLSGPHSFWKLICRKWNRWYISLCLTDFTLLFPMYSVHASLQTSVLWESFCSWLMIGKESRFWRERLDLGFCSCKDMLREKTTGSNLSLTTSCITNQNSPISFSHVHVVIVWSHLIRQNNINVT